MKSCWKRRTAGTTFTLPCKCQGLCDMKAFRQKMEEKCKTAEAPELSSRYEEFCTGSKYKGEWRKGYGMHGYGEYTFPHGVVYEGEFRNGEMHGTGQLRYKTENGTAAVRGKWENGKMTERTITFDDVLDYDEENWKYCKMPDRRFAAEFEKGLMPGARSYHTPNQPALKVPLGYCDTEDGFYYCKRKLVVKHEDATKLVRAPHLQEQKWILDNCRVDQETLNVGPLEGLYEKFVEPTQFLESPPAPLVDTRLQLKSEYSDSFESEQQKTIYEINNDRCAHRIADLNRPPQ